MLYSKLLLAHLAVEDFNRLSIVMIQLATEFQETAIEILECVPSWGQGCTQSDNARAIIKRQNAIIESFSQ